MTDEPEFGAPPWKRSPVVTAADLKKAIADAVKPLLPDLKARVLLDVNDQVLHVQLTGTLSPTYEQLQDAILRKLAEAQGMTYEELTADWLPPDRT